MRDDARVSTCPRLEAHRSARAASGALGDDRQPGLRTRREATTLEPSAPERLVGGTRGQERGIGTGNRSRLASQDDEIGRLVRLGRQVVPISEVHRDLVDAGRHGHRGNEPLRTPARRQFSPCIRLPTDTAHERRFSGRAIGTDDGKGEWCAGGLCVGGRTAIRVCPSERVQGRCGSRCSAVDACPQSWCARTVELVNVGSAASHAHHQREGRSGDQRSGTRGKRPIVCAQLQTGNGGAAGNREVAVRKEVSHWRRARRRPVSGAVPAAGGCLGRARRPRRGRPGCVPRGRWCWG